MKTTLLTMALLLASTLTFAQMYIQKEIDEMDGEVTYSYSEYIDEMTQDKRALIFPVMNEDLDPHTIAVISRGIGECVENSELIILFVDGSRVTAKSWNDFNCDGNSFFTITRQMKSKLESKRIDKIRIKNGRNYESFTFEVSNPEYFIEAYSLSRAGIVKNK